MRRSFKVLLVVLFFAAFAALTALYISTHTIDVLEPMGLIGEKQRDLIYLSSLLMLIVVVPVLILSLLFAWKYREGNENATYSPEWEHSSLAEFIWWGVPIVIITILGVITWKTSHELNPFKPIVAQEKPLRIQAVALEWKWLFIYPEQGIATVNELHIPEKTPIAFEITADAPMNSFWIPRLGGQIYAMPGMRTKLHLIANEPGMFRGLSSNLSGDGFAGMFFTVTAEEKGQFDQWVQSVRASSPSLGQREYMELAKPSQYAPVSQYVLGKADLFDWIVMKYMGPM